MSEPTGIQRYWHGEMTMLPEDTGNWVAYADHVRVVEDLTTDRDLAQRGRDYIHKQWAEAQQQLATAQAEVWEEAIQVYDHNNREFSSAACRKLQALKAQQCQHEWGIDGQHSNEYCKKCFQAREVPQ